MRIALDIDGVIASTDREMRRRIRDEFYLTDDLLLPGETYNNVYRHDDEEIHTRVNDRVRELFQIDSDLYLHADPIEGSVEGSHIIQPIAYITRRPDANGIGHATLSWLWKNGYYYAPVYFIPKGTCKSVKSKELDIDVLIEDSPHEIESCRSNGLSTVVMRYGYNSHILNESTVSVGSWSDILSLPGI